MGMQGYLSCGWLNLSWRMDVVAMGGDLEAWRPWWPSITCVLLMDLPAFWGEHWGRGNVRTNHGEGVGECCGWHPFFCRRQEARAREIDYYVEIPRISGSGPTAMLTLVLAPSPPSQLLFLECCVQCHPPTTWAIRECFLMYLRQENHHHFSLQILFLLYLLSSTRSTPLGVILLECPRHWAPLPWFFPEFYFYTENYPPCTSLLQPFPQTAGYLVQCNQVQYLQLINDSMSLSSLGIWYLNPKKWHQCQKFQTAQAELWMDGMEHSKSVLSGPYRPPPTSGLPAPMTLQVTESSRTLLSQTYLWGNSGEWPYFPTRK